MIDALPRVRECHWPAARASAALPCQWYDPPQSEHDGRVAMLALVRCSVDEHASWKRLK